MQQQNLEHVRHQHVDVPVLRVFSQHFEVGTVSEQGSATTFFNIDETKCVPALHGVDQVVGVSVPQVDEQQRSTQDQQQTVEQEIHVSAMIFQHVDVSASFVPYEPVDMPLSQVLTEVGNEDEIFLPCWPAWLPHLFLLQVVL